MKTVSLRFAFACLCVAALWAGGCTSWETHTDQYVLSPGFEEKLEQVNFQFNRNRFDSVGTLLLVMESETNTPLEKYLMACYQAEVLYYNLLPKPAIANLDAAMEIAKASGKPELVANCENYYALFHIIDQKPREAQVHLWRAKSLLPADTTFEFLVNDYQILSNLGEVHLMLHNSDSALHYARQSQAITRARNIERGTVLNHWILGQVYLQKTGSPRPNRRLPPVWKPFVAKETATCSTTCTRASLNVPAASTAQAKPSTGYVWGRTPPLWNAPPCWHRPVFTGRHPPRPTISGTRTLRYNWKRNNCG